MTRKELIERMYELDVFETKKSAGDTLDFLLNLITSEVHQGNEVALGQSFGKFVPARQAARSGINAINGQPFESPAKQVIKFKPSAVLKRTIAA